MKVSWQETLARRPKAANVVPDTVGGKHSTYKVPVRLTLIITVSLWASTALANPYLDSAKKLYAAQRFTEAMQQLLIAKQVPNQELSERIETFDLLARTQIAEGHRAEAEQSYVELLTLAADWEPSGDRSPKLLQPFDAAKRRLFAPGFVALKPQTPLNRNDRLELLDPWHQVTSVQMKSERSDGWVAVPLPVKDRLIAIPPQPDRWLVEALRSDGKVVAHWGTEAAPQPPTVKLAPDTLAVAQASPAPTATLSRSPVYRWLLVGLAVAAAAGGATFQWLAARDAQAAKDEPWVDRALGLQARATTKAAWATGLWVGTGLAGAGAVALFVF